MCLDSALSSFQFHETGIRGGGLSYKRGSTFSRVNSEAEGEGEREQRIVMLHVLQFQWIKSFPYLHPSYSVVIR